MTSFYYPKKIEEYRKELYVKMKILNDQGDDRYPRPFIQGYVLGLERAIRELDKKINEMNEENHEY